MLGASLFNPFSFEDYKIALKSNVEANSSTHGYRAKLAKAAGCQRSFLSQVLHSHVHLTADHAAGLCAFWKLNNEATSYFLDLVAFARASTPRLRKLLEDRIRQAQKSHGEVHARIQKYAAIPEEHRTKFYSAWYMSAIYMLSGVGEFRQPEKIAIRLNLPLPQVLKTLESLEKMGVVQQKKHGWFKTETHLYLKDSAHRLPFLSNWRQIASLRAQNQAEDSVHLSHLYVFTDEELKRLRERLSDLVDDLWKKSNVSPDQGEAVCFNLDLFPL